MADISLWQLVLANLALLAGACLQGVAGYGIGTLSAPLLFLISPTLVPGVAVLNALALNLLMLLRHHQGVTFRPVRYAIAGSLVGTALAASTLAVLSVNGFELTFGVLILVAVALSVAGLRPALTSCNSVLAGGASGFMGTITAIGGPPIALIYQNEKGLLVRANLSAFFLFSCLAAVVALVPAGYIGRAELTLLVFTLPGVLIGFWLSAHLVNRLPFDALRPIILSVAALTGIAAVVRGVMALL